MAAYRTIVVGTDGSETSLRAVDRAAQLANDCAATLVIACAYLPRRDRESPGEQPGIEEAVDVVGVAPADDTLRTASFRAKTAGASLRVETEAVAGKPADVLIALAGARQADLLVVGNRGLNSLAGRLLGSVPLDVARHAGLDVLIVHTT
jgi:nucleotide-binding universal stress UspA family protein